MQLIIPDRYFLRWESYAKFGYGHSVEFNAVRYVFAVPDTAGLESGYTIYIHTYDVSRSDSTAPSYREVVAVGAKKEHYAGAYHIEVQNDAVFTAIKTESREQGKKYARHKFNALELQAMYNGHDLNDAVDVVAKVLIYQNDDTRLAGRIMEEKVIVGKKVGCWLYSEDLDSKRRISTKGVRILGEIDGASVYSVRTLIADYKKEISSIQRSENVIARRLYQVDSLMRDIEYMKALVSGADEPPYVESLQDNAEKLKEFLQSSAQKTDEVIRQSETKFYERLYSLCRDPDSKGNQARAREGKTRESKEKQGKTRGTGCSDGNGRKSP